MRIFMNVTLACLFVFLAGFNVWNMLAVRSASARSNRLWTQIHRAVGYLFIAIFVILCYVMLMRLKGRPDEISPKVALHMGLALLLGPLLFAKVISARYQKAARGLLTGLGICIFCIAFTLVALNVSTHYLERASIEKAPAGISTAVVAVALGLAAIAFFAKNKRPDSGRETGSPVKQTRGELTGRGELLHLTLARIEKQTTDAKTLRFLLEPGRQISARPGQFLTFEWMIDGKPVIRSYSICSSPAQRGFIEITPKRVENGCVSTFLNDRAALGLSVKARGPFGQFYFDESKHKHVVLIAGGSGITPLMAILRYMDDLCISVDCTLIYCVRREEDIFFKDQLHALQNRLSQFHSVVILSQPGSHWTGWVGHLCREILDSEISNLQESIFFLCGPPAFMELARALLKDMAVDSARILQESFGGAVAGEKRPGEGVFRVEFARSSVAYNTSPDETLLESSERRGVLIPSGCRQGSCGTCATKLLVGNVDMGNGEALSDEMESQGYILPCVSRPLSDVTLDA